jgi:hypothetical protein
MNFTTSGINGTITEWDGPKGSLQSDTASGTDKTFWLTRATLSFLATALHTNPRSATGLHPLPKLAMGQG